MIYFLSDCHLGAGTMHDPLEYERRLVRFLQSIEGDCEELFLMGDIIDYWFEYRKVVPKGFVRFFGQIARMTDSGIRVHWFAGNHDIWLFGYLHDEIGVEIHHKAEVLERYGKRLFLAHGDGLGDDNLGYRLMSGFFRSPFTQMMYRKFIHPDLATRFAHWWSKKSRLDGNKFPEYLGDDKEHLMLFAERYLGSQNLKTSEPQNLIDYFIFGHRHIMVDRNVPNKNARLLILGDWITHFSYATLSQTGNVELKNYKQETYL